MGVFTIRLWLVRRTQTSVVLKLIIIRILLSILGVGSLVEVKHHLVLLSHIVVSYFRLVDGWGKKQQDP